MLKFFFSRHNSSVRLALLAVFVAATLHSQAALHTFTGAVSDQWSNAANWQPSGIPGSADTAVIANGATVSLPQDATVGTLNLAGNLRGPGKLTVSSSSIWTSGTLFTPLILNPTATLNIQGDDAKRIDATLLDLRGSTLWTGAGGIVGLGGGAISNSGLFTVRNDAAFSFCCYHPTGSFTNKGTFVKESGTNTVFSEFAFSNEGTLDVRSGTVSLGGGGRSPGEFITSNNASIDFTGGIQTLVEGASFNGAGRARTRGGTIVLDGKILLAPGATFELASGLLNGLGSVHGPGQFLWTGGTITAAMSIAPETRMQIDGIENKRLEGGKLSNNGSMTWTGAGSIVGIGGGAITNAALFEIQNDSVFTFCCYGPIPSFINLPTGTFRKTSATNETTFAEFQFFNQGLVDVQSGSLVLKGPAHELNSGGRFAGAGRTRVLTSIKVSGASTLEAGGTVELAPGGIIEGIASLSGPGTFEWSGGDIRGQLSLSSSTQWLISGNDNKHLNAGLVNTAGTAHWTGTGRIVAFGGGRINNSGLFEVQSDATASFCCYHPLGLFHNQSTGIFRKTAGPGQTVFSEVQFNNDGLVEVLQGSLILAAGGSGSGAFTNASNASIKFTGGTMVLNSSSNNNAIAGFTRIEPGAILTLNGPHSIPAGSKFELAGGVVNGSGSLTGPGTFEWSSGDIKGQLTVSPETKMIITSDAHKRIEAGQLHNQGSITWTGNGHIVGFGGSSITNSGLFEIKNDSVFSFCCYNPIANFFNGPSGTLRKTSATGESVLGEFIFQNEGTVDIQSGVLALRSQTHALKDGGRFKGAGRTVIESTVELTGGTNRIEAGGTLELIGALSGQGTFAGPGTFLWSGGTLRGLTLHIAPETTVLINGPANKRIEASTLNNAGRAIWTGTGDITGLGGGLINNTGTFEVKNSSSFNFCCYHPIASFINRPGALFRKTSTGETAFRDFSFLNEGRMSIQGGLLRLPDGSVIPGVCPVKVPAALSIDLLPSNTEALLSWTHGGIDDGGDNLQFSGFEIEKSVDNGPFQPIASVPPGVFQLRVPEACDGPVNSYRIRATSDGCASSFSAAVKIPRSTVPPTFTTKPPELAAAEKPFTYDADAVDPEGAKVVYVLLNPPAGMTVDPLTGKVLWTPPSSLRGQFVTVTLMAFNGACGAKGIQEFTLGIGETPPPGGFKLQVGKVVLSTDTLFRLTGDAARSGRFVSPSALTIEDGTYKVGGDTKINDYLRFDGSVIVTLNKTAATLDVKIDQGKVYLTGIPFVGNKTIWQGGNVAFTIDGNGEITRLLQDQLGKPLQAAGMDIQIDRARLLLDNDLGIRIFGKLNFPDVYGMTALSASFDNLEISQNNGVRFTGQIRLADFDLGGMGVRNIRLNWMPQEDPTQDIFEGEGELNTPAFAMACKVRLVAGGLDGIYSNLDFGGIGIPVPPGPTPFFNITGGGMGIEGLRGGPFSVRLDANITLVHPMMKNVVSLNKAGITYTYPSTLKGSGDLRILNAKAAKAYLNLDLPYRFGLGGKVELIEQFPVLIIEADLTAGVNPDPLRFFFEGGASGKLQIPSYDNFPDAVKKAFPPLFLAKPFLPKTIAQAGIAYRNNTFSSTLGLPIIGDIVVAVKQSQNQVQLLVGQNLSSLTKIIGFNSELSYDGMDVRDSIYQTRMLSALGRDRDSMGGGHLEGDGLFIPAALSSTAETVATVNIPPNAPRVIFRLFGEAGAPRYQLIKPDGSRLTPENPGGAHYEQSVQTRESYFVVTSPAAGSWTVEAENAANGPFVLDAWGANAPPAITALATTQSADNITIDYSVADPDDAVSLALFYDSDAQGFDGSLIAEFSQANPSGSHTWNSASANLPSGTYSIYAIVDDGKNLPTQRYATGSITILDPNAPATPKNFKVQPGGENSLLVSWDANSEPNLRGYQIRVAEDTGPATELTEVIDAGPTNSFRITKLKGETTYRVAVIAYSQSEQAPAAGLTPTPVVHRSAPSESAVAKTDPASIPNVRLTSPNGAEVLAQNSSINISWKIENGADLADQQIELSTDSGQSWRPIAKNLAREKRNFSWDIPLGLDSSRARIRVSALDTAGNEGSDASDANFHIAATDSDGDGLPDSFETLHGLNPDTAGDQIADADSDGISNLQEYLAGTNPKDANSAFRFTQVVPFTDGIQIHFTTSLGRTYRVEKAADPASDNWIIIEDNIPGSGAIKQVIDTFSESASSSFYRVRLID